MTNWFCATFGAAVMACAVAGGVLPANASPLTTGVATVYTFGGPASGTDIIAAAKVTYVPGHLNLSTLEIFQYDENTNGIISDDTYYGLSSFHYLQFNQNSEQYSDDLLAIADGHTVNYYTFPVFNHDGNIDSFFLYEPSLSISTETVSGVPLPSSLLLLGASLPFMGVISALTRYREKRQAA